MNPQLEIKDLASSIISFATLFEHDTKIILHEQNLQQSDLLHSSLIIDYIVLFANKIRPEICKEVIQIPKLIHSLVKLCIYKLNIHTNLNDVYYALQIRVNSLRCLYEISIESDEQDHTKLFSVGYANILAKCISNCGGIGEQDDYGIYYGLQYINKLFNSLHQGRNYPSLPLFPPQPLLTKICNEQIEEEGANEEIQSLLISKKQLYGRSIKDYANWTDRELLNIYINGINPQLRKYWNF